MTRTKNARYIHKKLDIPTKNITFLTNISFCISYLGQYQCFAKNEWGTATTNSVFIRKSELNNFKDEPPKTLSVEEGAPYGIECDSPDGWPNPSVYWMLQGQNWLKTINSSRYVHPLFISGFEISKVDRNRYNTKNLSNFDI